MVKRLLISIALSIPVLADAESFVSNVVVNQRWPWSEKVDVDFILSGATNDVEVFATWDGRSEPYRLGTVFSCAAGKRRLTWNPSASEFAGQTLTGFEVSVTNAAPGEHKYLVLDLVNGGYVFLSDVPSGGWTDDHKSSKMVFRRIPAGMYTLGEPKDTFSFLGLSDSASQTCAEIWNRRTVTYTSDFYVGVFAYTEAQHECLTNGAPGTSFKPEIMSYDKLRGTGANWPVMGYAVSSNSVVAKLRAKADGLVVDLCQEGQWEVAARAGTTTILPNGVTTNDTMTTFTNKLNEIASWLGTKTGTKHDVGSFNPNEWGLYDVCGLAAEWMLDWAVGPNTLPTNGLPSTSTDPVGVEKTTTSGGRVLKSTSGNWSTFRDIHQILPCSRQITAPDTGKGATRFCIHLKPLGDLSFPCP